MFFFYRGISAYQLHDSTHLGSQARESHVMLARAEPFTEAVASMVATPLECSCIG